MDKKIARIRRATRTRSNIKRQEQLRLTVHRTAQHMYAQIMTHDGAKVLACASTLDAQVKEQNTGKSTGNVAAATIVGKVIAERALAAGLSKVAFDRSGFRYHGRVKALAEAARSGGLEF